MSLATVRAGLKTVLGGVSGLTVYGFLAMLPHTPAAVVGFPEELNPDVVLGPGTDYRIDVALFVGLADDNVADITLTALVDSVLTALAVDPTLAGAAMSAIPVRVGDFGQAPLGDAGPMALGCLVTVEVYT